MSTNSRLVAPWWLWRCLKNMNTYCAPMMLKYGNSAQHQDKGRFQHNWCYARSAIFLSSFVLFWTVRSLPSTWCTNCFSSIMLWYLFFLFFKLFTLLLLRQSPQLLFSCAATPVLLSSPTVNETILAMSSPFWIHLNSQFRFNSGMLQSVHRLVRLVWAVSFYCRSSTFRPHQRSLFVF